MKKKQTKNRRPKRRKAKKPQTTAIVPVPQQTVYVRGRERILDDEEIQLIRKLCAKDADENEFKLFMTICRKSKLDPFLKQIYCVIWPTQGGKSHDMVIITGINGFRTMAARDHKDDYAGSSAAKYTWFDPPRLTPAKRNIPETATVEIYGKHGEPATTATVYWEEYAPANLTEKRADFWNRMPRNQLEKCAEAKGLRKRYPGLGNIFTEEELSARLQDLTEGGRQISIGGVAPSGQIVDQQEAGRVASQKVLDEKLAHGHPPGSPEAQKAEQTLQRVEEEDRRFKEAKKVSQPGAKATAAAPAAPSAGHIEIDWADKKSPILRGDLTEILDLLKEQCSMTWGPDGFWHITPEDVPAVKALCKQIGFTGHEFIPKKSSGKPEAKPEKKTKSAGADPGAHPAPAALTLVNGTLHNTIVGMTKNKAPMLNAKINNAWHMCFVNTIFEYLTKGHGQIVEVWINEKGNLVGLKRVGRHQFDDDGRTPVIQKDREVGGKTLFT